VERTWRVRLEGCASPEAVVNGWKEAIVMQGAQSDVSGRDVHTSALLGARRRAVASGDLPLRRGALAGLSGLADSSWDIKLQAVCSGSHA